MKRLHLSFFLFTILIFSTMLGFGNVPIDSAIIRADWKELKTKQYGIHYPYTWKLSQGEPGTGFTLYVPGPKSFGAFEKSLSLSIQDLSGRDLDLDGYTYLSKRQIHTLVDNSELLESERIDSLATPYHEIVYTGNYDEQKLRWKMRFWVVNNKAYILTYTASNDTYSLSAEKVKEIMDTFTLNHVQMGVKKSKKKKGKKEKKPKKGKVPTTDVSRQ